MQSCLSCILLIYFLKGNYQNIEMRGSTHKGLLPNIQLFWESYHKPILIAIPYSEITWCSRNICYEFCGGKNHSKNVFFCNCQITVICIYRWWLEVQSFSFTDTQSQSYLKSYRVSVVVHYIKPVLFQRNINVSLPNDCSNKHENTWSNEKTAPSCFHCHIPIL